MKLLRRAVEKQKCSTLVIHSLQICHSYGVGKRQISTWQFAGWRRQAVLRALFTSIRTSCTNQTVSHFSPNFPKASFTPSVFGFNSKAFL